MDDLVLLNLNCRRVSGAGELTRAFGAVREGGEFIVALGPEPSVDQRLGTMNLPEEWRVRLLEALKP